MNVRKPLPPLDPVWFWAQVEVSDKDNCWPWKNYVSPRGYGAFTKKGVGYRAHRAALSLATGEDYPELLACHTCDNPGCCNPAHLYWGTQKQNMCDRRERGRAHKKLGVKNHNAKLNPEKAREIRKLASGMTTTALAKRFEVDRKAIWMILKNVTWKEIDMNPA